IGSAGHQYATMELPHGRKPSHPDRSESLESHRRVPTNSDRSASHASCGSAFRFGKAKVRTVVAATATASCLRRRCVGCGFVAVILTTTATAGADDELASARDLYMAAAYEDALTRLNALHAGGRGTADERAIEQYR